MTSKKTPIQYNNLDKTQKDCLTLIESLGIYELRALARVFGDNSPTTLKRNDHISIVMNKIISGEDLRPIPLRQGRPYKELSNIEGILAELSQLTGKDYTLKENQQHPVANRMPKNVSFRQVEADIYSQKLFPIEVSGVLCERNEKELYFISQNNGKLVLVKKNINPKINVNDYVIGTAVVMNEEKEYILESITSINYKPENEYTEISNPYEMAMPTEKLFLENNEITLGSRYLIQEMKFINCISRVKNLVDGLKNNGITTIALIANVMPEERLSISELGFDNTFIVKYDDRPFATFDTLSLFVEHIKRLQNEGYKIAMFVEDINTIANAIDYAFRNNTKALMGHTETTVDILKQMLMLAKAGGNNKSTTLFSTLDEVDMLDPMYVSSVYKISKKLN